MGPTCLSLPFLPYPLAPAHQSAEPAAEVPSARLRPVSTRSGRAALAGTRSLQWRRRRLRMGEEDQRSSCPRGRRGGGRARWRGGAPPAPGGMLVATEVRLPRLAAALGGGGAPPEPGDLLAAATPRLASCFLTDETLERLNAGFIGFHMRWKCRPTHFTTKKRIPSLFFSFMQFDDVTP